MLKINMLFIFALIAFAFAGCGHHGSDTFTHETTTLHHVVFDPVYHGHKLGTFDLTETKTFKNGSAYKSTTDLLITNTTDATLSYNFIVSSYGWTYESAVVNLPPHSTKLVKGITHYFYALDQFWVTIEEPVVYSFAG